MALIQRAAMSFALALLAAPAMGQEPLSRPAFLEAMGLLSVETIEIAQDEMPAIEMDLPSSDRVAARVQDVPEEAAEVLAAFDFVTPDGVLAESLVLTKAKIEEGAREARLFAMANLLVLRSFPALARSVEDARLLGFGPMRREDGILSVQMVGTFSSPDGAQLFFRHVGLMFDDTEAAIVAIINTNDALLPIRSEASISDTFAGTALDSLRLKEGP